MSGLKAQATLTEQLRKHYGQDILYSTEQIHGMQCRLVKTTMTDAAKDALRHYTGDISTQLLKCCFDWVTGRAGYFKTETAANEDFNSFYSSWCD